MNTYTTRSGRVSKKPVRYEPVEECTDDYSDDEYNNSITTELDDEQTIDIIDVCDSESESEDSDASDADSDGNLKDFVVSDDEMEYDSDYCESDDDEDYVCSSDEESE